MSLDLTGITLPFDAGDLLSSGNALMGIVGGFILLALAFKVVPLLIGLVVNAFKAAKGN